MKSAMFQAHAQMEVGHWWFAGRRRCLDPLLEAVTDANGLIVDVGCGTGGTVGELSRNRRIVGLDSSPEAIALARTSFPGCDFQQGDVTGDLQPLAAQADVILLMDVLEHVEGDRAFLKSIVQSAKIGSHILITVPADMRLWSRHDETAGHLRRYDPLGLAALWDRLPVQVRLCSHFNARLFWPIFIVRSFMRFLGVTFGTGGSDFKMPPAWLNRLLCDLFAGEGALLAGALDTGKPPYQRGVSLVALLRRIES